MDLLAQDAGAPSLRLSLSTLDVVLLTLFFVWVIGIGFVLRKAMASSLDFFLAIVMMPFYYGSRVRSVPEYIRLRYDRKAHLINAITYVIGSLLIAGVNLFALATVIEALLGIPLPIAIVVSAVFVLSYILLGGVTSAIYTEVLQFFVILAGLIPLLIVTLKSSGGLTSLWNKLEANQGHHFVSTWAG